MPAKLLIGLGCLAALAAACTSSETEQPSRSREAVIHGQVSPPSDDGIVWLTSMPAGSTTTWPCTGTLIAPNLLVTARHCVAAYTEGFFSCDANGDLVSSTGGGYMGAVDPPENITVRAGKADHPPVVAKGKQVIASQTTSICRNDIAFVVLDTVLSDLPIFPIRLYSGVESGEQIRVVGYGADEDGGLFVRHSLSGLTVGLVGSSQFLAVGDAIPPRTFTTSGPALCYGDSGGPALSDNGAVVGVFSQFDGTCTSPATKDYYTQTAPFAGDLVTQAFAASGYEPWLEGNSEPGLYGLGGSAASSGGTTGTGGNVSSAGGVGGSAGSEPDTGGAPDEIIYTGAPPSGGACMCRAAGAQHRARDGLLASLALLGVLRRRRTKGR